MQVSSVYHLELICKFFFFLLQLVHCFLIPAPGLGLQITGSSRDDSRLLEQSTIQGNRLKGENDDSLGETLNIQSFHLQDMKKV